MARDFGRAQETRSFFVAQAGELENRLWRRCSSLLGLSTICRHSLSCSAAGRNEELAHLGLDPSGGARFARLRAKRTPQLRARTPIVHGKIGLVRPLESTSSLMIEASDRSRVFTSRCYCLRHFVAGLRTTPVRHTRSLRHNTIVTPEQRNERRRRHRTTNAQAPRTNSRENHEFICVAQTRTRSGRQIAEQRRNDMCAAITFRPG